MIYMTERHWKSICARDKKGFIWNIYYIIYEYVLACGRGGERWAERGHHQDIQRQGPALPGLYSLLV